MTINPRPIHQIIQEVNQNIETSGRFDRRVLGTLFEINTAQPMTPADQMELMALAARVTVLSQPRESGGEISQISRAFSLFKSFLESVGSSIVSQDLKDSVSLELRSKANLNIDEALQIEAALSRYPKLREDIIRDSSSFMNERMSIEEKVAILKRVGDEKMESLIEECRMVAKSGIPVFEQIKKHGIVDQNFIIDIVKIAAAKSVSGVSEHIKNYGIIDEKDRIEIAKIAAAANGWKVSECIKNYKITNKDALIEIAKIAAAQRGSGVSRYIQNYGITNKDALIEIAKIAAAQSGSGVSQYIKNYGITNRNILIEIAKIAAAQNGDGVSQYIKNYGITNPDALIKIAKIAADQSGWGVSFHIKNYGISDRDVLIEIAKIAAAQDGRGVSQYIKNYKITDPNALIEISKIAAAQSGSGVSQYIKNYGIENSDVLIEIAKIAAAQSGSGVSEYIKRYGITDQKVLIEIAKMAAAQSGKGVSQYIKNYGIENSDVLIEIAKIAAAQDGNGVSEYIKNYKITDPNALIEIAKIAFHKDPIKVLLNLRNFELDDSSSEYRDLLLCGCLCGFAFGGERFIRVAETSSVLDLFLKKKAVASVEEEAHTKKEPRTLFHSFLQINAKSLLPEDVWRESDREIVLKKIEAYRNESIAASLGLCVLAHSSNGEFKDSYLFFASKETTKNELMAHQILPSIVLAKWLMEAKREATLTSSEEEIASKLKIFLANSRSEFRNNDSPLMQTFLLATLDLDKAEGISSIRKLEILSSICNSVDYSKGFGLIRSLCARKETRALNPLPLENPIDELKDLFERSLLKDRYIDLSGIENLSDKYFNAFEKTRTPFALEIYTTKLRTLPDERVKATLNRFVRSVLGGTFEAERYCIDKSVHLQKIHEYDQIKGTNVLEGWKNLSFEAPVTSVSETTEEKIFSFEDFFRQKLGDGHGCKDGAELLTDLSSFLKADLVDRMTILEGLEQRIKTEQGKISSEKDSVEKARKRSQLKIDQMQKACIELIADSSLSREDLMNKLERLPLVRDLEISNDLQGLLKSLKTPQKSSSLEKIQFCAGWEDLFLSGTEVTGSCQRIDGEANYNKCLLAYCLDGKNTMLAVKGPDEKILARCMLRLLWNKTDSKPVLFLDRLYPSPCNKEREKATLMAAKECAKQVGLELFTAGMGGSPSEKIIESLGSSCPFEYADASDGVMHNGIFTIRNAKKNGLD